MRRPLPKHVSRGPEQPSELPTPTPTPTPPSTTTPSDGKTHQAFVATATCSGGYTYITCLDATLENDRVVTGAGTYQNCRQQNQTPDWTRMSTELTTRGLDVVAPAKIIARQGATCGPEVPANEGSYTTYAEQCVDGNPVCMTVDFSVDSSNVPTITNLTETSEWDTTPDGESQCSVNWSSPASVTRLLKEAGLTQSHDACQAAPQDGLLYAARKQCVTTMKYAPGWPTSGGVDISSNLLIRCYGLSGLDGNAPIATFAQEKQCSSQNPTTEQKRILASLAPDYYDYQELDRTCEIKGGVNLNLQIRRDPVARGSRLVSGVRGYKKVATFESKERFVYACTDLAKTAGAYDQPYFAANNPYGTDTYPSDKGNCPIEKISNMALIQQGWAPGDLDQTGQRDTDSQITVEDIADESQFLVTKINTFEMGEQCAGEYAESDICFPDTDGVQPLDLDGNGIPDADDWVLK